MLNELKIQFTKAQNHLIALEAQKKLLEKQLKEAEQKRSAAEKELAICDKVQILLQKTSDFARMQAKKRIEEIVSQALSVVFGGNQKFTIEIKTKANQPYAEYWLNEIKLERPDFSRGGGVVDVVTLALRLAIMELLNVRGPILLDEVGKHVSAEYAPNVAYFLKQYAESFNRQIVLITHNTALAGIGEISLNVNMKNGESEVKSL